MVYVSDSITPVLNQPQVNISDIFPCMVMICAYCSLSVESTFSLYLMNQGTTEKRTCLVTLFDPLS